MELEDFFRRHGKAALAFSGGVDSGLLLCAGARAGADIRPYFVKTAFQPRFELEDARRLARQLGLEPAVLELDVLDLPQVAANGPDRCYHCKKALLGALKRQAALDGYELLLEGSNASDDPAARPGMKALAELGFRSPLRELGLTKEAIRSLARQWGLFSWDKPAYACLATRIPTGRAIAAADLARVEEAERELAALGFSDLRVRLFHDAARIQIPPCQMTRALEQREAILRSLKPYFREILLDLEGR